MRYEKKFSEGDSDLNELIGSFKAEYQKISQVKTDKEFKKLSQADRDYVIGELKADFM